MRIPVILGVSFLLMMIQGCAILHVGVRLTVTENDFPISISEGILGYDNELVLNDGYEVVHHFTLEKSATTWNFFHFWFFRNPKRIDLSADFEEVVRVHKGEAIVNLTIKAQEDLSTGDVVSGLLTLGLIAPCSVKITLEGDVIRLKTTTTTSDVRPSIQSNT